MSGVTCGVCTAANEPGRKFCGECGASLARTCPSCGTANQASVKYCGECGAALGAAGTALPTSSGGSHPVAERRLVSVLFADLVGFTNASEGRDSEDTRELLTHYFDTCRSIIERYGGTVEKFIGDAVMAVWGAPVATEDDAERAVRAALDLVDAIPALDRALRARAGVLTGEAAVTLGATDQGMVAGDLVNTASRIQATADPGTVLAGETTRRATEASIDYEDAGEHELKGKSERIRLWRAMRVATHRRGGGRPTTLEAPFVGRSSELRLLKEIFHASAEESRARLVSVVGVAGIGKSRLSWEFQKHIDGLVEDVWWHRGRCLSYGEGVAFWALAEMVRSRAKILEDDGADLAATKLRATIAEHIPDEAERQWVEPRLFQLVGLSERSAPDREDLFSAWRRFFERLAEQGPLVLVFEDLHWADEGLVAFIDYLLDWGRHHPIFVLTLSRPEVADRHPTFPGSTRSATTMPLEPMDDAAMDELLAGLVPELPDDVRARLREAAGGIPLFAVETVRMLRDRGLLTGDDPAAVQVGDLSRFEVPETLHALVASRLDALPEAERRLLQDGAVLGQTFTARGLAALSGLSESEIEPLVTDLVRKEMLAVETDPFSPERGQLGFVQALVQRVKYETISRRDRRVRHLAAARFLSGDAGLDPDEIAEVIAAHFLDAHEADPAAPDADDVRAQARGWFTRAAERAASLAASLEAQRSFVRAAALADVEVDRGRSLARAGELATMGGRLEEAEPLLEEAIAILRAAGAQEDAARAEVARGDILFAADRLDEGIGQLTGALETYETAGDEAAIATVSAQLGRFCLFAGQHEEAMAHVERALELSERLGLGDVVIQALINKGITLRQRPNESLALMRHAVLLAEAANDWRGVARACMNLGYLLSLAGREAEATEASERGLLAARRLGDRVWERSLAANLCSGYVVTGMWDEAERAAAELPEDGEIPTDPVHANIPLTLATIALRRGETARALALTAPFVAWGESMRVQAELVGVTARALTALAEGRNEDAVRSCATAIRDERAGTVVAYVDALLELTADAAWSSLTADVLEELVDLVDDHDGRTPLGDAVIELHRVRLAVLRDDPGPAFPDVVEGFRALGDPYWVAVSLLDHATWLVTNGAGADAAPLLAEAREIFERLRAAPGLARIADTARATVPAGG